MKKVRILASALVISLLAGCNIINTGVRSVEILKDSTQIE